MTSRCPTYALWKHWRQGEHDFARFRAVAYQAVASLGWLSLAASLTIAVATGFAGCGGTEEQARQAVLKAQQAELKAEQAEAAADRAQAAARQAQIAADRAQKAVEDATREINRVSDHLEQLNHSQD